MTNVTDITKYRGQRGLRSIFRQTHKARRKADGVLLTDEEINSIESDTERREALRAKLAADVDEWLAKGNEIEQVPTGEMAFDHNRQVGALASALNTEKMNGEAK
jgi:hypothetical protein